MIAAPAAILASLLVGFGAIGPLALCDRRVALFLAASAAAVMIAVPAAISASFLVGFGPIGPLALSDRRVALFLAASAAAVVTGAGPVSADNDLLRRSSPMKVAK